MKFIVKRADNIGHSYLDYDQPIKGTILESLETVQIRTYIGKDDWDKNGWNHRIVNDVPGLTNTHIRNNNVNYWTIEINNMEDLMKIVEKEGPVIISKEYDEPLPRLLIYDNYIE